MIETTVDLNVDGYIPSTFILALAYVIVDAVLATVIMLGQVLKQIKSFALVMLFKVIFAIFS